MSTIIASHPHENDYGMGISAFRVCVNMWYTLWFRFGRFENMLTLL